MTDNDRLGAVKDSGAILRFAFPTIIVMVVISSYSIADGAIISNMLGKEALAGLNIVMPVISVLNAFGFMLSTGGSAYVAKKLGEGRKDEANRSFSAIMVTAVIISLAFMMATIPFIDTLVDLLGADETLYGYAHEYLLVGLSMAPLFVLQYVCMEFLIADGRPGLSLAASVTGGIVNIVLDVVFIGVLGMGIGGPALASGIGGAVPVVIGCLCFLSRGSTIRFARPKFEGTMLAKVCSNGASEMVTNLSGSVTTLLFNLVMMKYLGADDVAAITIVMYVEFLAIALILGYSMGVAPLMSYNYGAGDRRMMTTLFQTSKRFVLSVSLAVFLSMEIFGKVIIAPFSGGSQDLEDIAVHGMRVFSLAYLFMGFNIYSSALFTSLSNGLLSALISVIRGLALLAPMIIILPMAVGIDGIWLAVPVTETVTMAVSLFLVKRMGQRYGYTEPPEDGRIADARPWTGQQRTPLPGQCGSIPGQVVLKC